MLNPVPEALTIAGSDPCGGAGIQADLRTFWDLGVAGASALTAVTVQDTTGVRGIHPVPVGVVRQQIITVLDDLPVKAIKIGMLARGVTVRLLSELLQERRPPWVVLDTPLWAKDGTPLLEGWAIPQLPGDLFPWVSLVTPNPRELEALCGFRSQNRGDMERAAHLLRQQGARAVLLKSGTGPGDEVYDLFLDGNGFRVFPHQRQAGDGWRGTGCILSAAIAAGLAQGKPLVEAVATAEDYLQEVLRRAQNLGRGYPIIQPCRLRSQDEP